MTYSATYPATYAGTAPVDPGGGVPNDPGPETPPVVIVPYAGGLGGSATGLVQADPTLDRTDTLTWIDATGRAVVLTDQPSLAVFWTPGVEGRGMPPYVYAEEELPFHAGAVIRTVKAMPREVSLPITVSGETYDELRSNVRGLYGLFDPELGDGLLRCREAADVTGNRVKELICRYSTGLQGQEWNDNSGWVFSKQVLVLRAVAPFWQDSSDTIATFNQLGATPFFPFYPLQVSPSQIVGAPTVVNNGDKSAEPVWTAYGPADGLTLSNGTRNLTLTYSWAAGRSVIIDTRQGHKSVRLDDGTNLFRYLGPNPDLWTMDVGVNNLIVNLVNARPGSSVKLAYRRRWLGV